MIENPIYGGAYAYGKTAVATGYGADGVGVKSRRKARAEWLALMPDAHEGYVSWERAEAIRKMVSRQRPDQPPSWRAQAWRRAARRADPLPPLRPQADAPLHRRASTTSRATAAAAAGWTMASRAASPLAACASTTPSRRRFSASSAPAPSRPPSRQRAKPASGATRCARRSCAILKRRAMRPIAPSANTTPPIRPTGWSPASWRRAGTRRSHACAEVESKIAAHDAATPTRRRIDPASLATLAADLKTVWSAPTTDARLKKRIVRTVIQEVVADIDDEAAEIVLVVHWIGGVHSEMRLPRRRRGQRNSTSADIIAAVRQLVLIANDDLIAGILNRNGLVTGHGNRWTRERVTSLRSHHRIPVHRPADDGVEPWLNLSKAARLLHIAPKTLQARGGSRRDRRDPSPARRSLDLQPRRSRNHCSPSHHPTRAAEPEIPHGIASRSAKPLLFNDIDRWVL